MLKLKLLNDIDSQKVWITTSDYINSDWPVRFLVRCLYTEEWSQEWANQVGKYQFEIHAVSPEALGLIGCAIVERSMDCTFDAMPREWQCLTLMEYGSSACLWQKLGNNQKVLLTEARKELQNIQMLFGFYMDRTINRLGATGWDFIRGDPAMRRRGEVEIDTTKEDELLGGL